MCQRSRPVKQGRCNSKAVPLVQVDVLMHADNGEIIVTDVNLVPDLSEGSVMLQQASDSLSDTKQDLVGTCWAWTLSSLAALIAMLWPGLHMHGICQQAHRVKDL